MLALTRSPPTGSRVVQVLYCLEMPCFRLPFFGAVTFTTRTVRVPVPAAGSKIILFLNIAPCPHKPIHERGNDWLDRFMIGSEGLRRTRLRRIKKVKKVDTFPALV